VCESISIYPRGEWDQAKITDSGRSGGESKVLIREAFINYALLKQYDQNHCACGFRRKCIRPGFWGLQP